MGRGYGGEEAVVILRLREILVEQEGLKSGETVCPHMSRYAVAEKPMQDGLEFQSFTVLCLGDSCGKHASCTANSRGGPLR